MTQEMSLLSHKNSAHFEKSQISHFRCENFKSMHFGKVCSREKCADGKSVHILKWADFFSDEKTNFLSLNHLVGMKTNFSPFFLSIEEQKMNLLIDQSQSAQGLEMTHRIFQFISESFSIQVSHFNCSAIVNKTYFFRIKLFFFILSTVRESEFQIKNFSKKFLGN